jgi:hypothetical protein
VNVDTGEFQALTERVERVEEILRNTDVAAEILRRAGMRDDVRDAGCQPERRARHLRLVE